MMFSDQIIFYHYKISNAVSFLMTVKTFPFNFLIFEYLKYLFKSSIFFLISPSKILKHDLYFHLSLISLISLHYFILYSHCILNTLNILFILDE